MQEKTTDEHIKRMADLLRQGATLTDLACPACASPIFRLKDGTLWCGNCEKKVIVVKEDEEPEALRSMAYDKLEATLLAKVADIQAKIQNTENVDELQKLSTALSELLSSLEKVKKMKKS
ncbi:MAG: Sjogren's syndrome/scleroderma autoantigen 1 family protein [Candidatus Bathyarchaeales archaeon]